MGKAQLHQVLAVESDLKTAKEKIFQETAAVLKKSEFFRGVTKKLEMFEEEDAGMNHTEHAAITTTVKDRVAYTLAHAIKYWDVLLQKERTNQEARADIVVDGTVIVADVPATWLLRMETEIKGLRAILDGMPTLPPGFVWDFDENEGVYTTRHPEITFKTEKKPTHKIIVEATKEHPAQVSEFMVTKNVGKYTKMVQSGALTSAEKAEILGRIDTLLRAIKKARQQANSAEVIKINAGKALVDFIEGK